MECCSAVQTGFKESSKPQRARTQISPHFLQHKIVRKLQCRADWFARRAARRRQLAGSAQGKDTALRGELGDVLLNARIFGHQAIVMRDRSRAAQCFLIISRHASLTTRLAFRHSTPWQHLVRTHQIKTQRILATVLHVSMPSLVHFSLMHKIWRTVPMCASPLCESCRRLLQTRFL